MSNRQNDETNREEEERLRRSSGLTPNEQDDDEDNEEESVAGAAAVVDAALNNESIGYCHVCDKQVPIDSDTFTCRDCHSGFIELFENETPQLQQQTNSNQQQPNSQRIRVESIPVINDANLNNLTNLLPLLLPQLLNPNLIAAGGGGGVSANTQQAQPSQQQHPPSNITFTSNAPGMTNQPPMAQRIGPTTRLQFIVPGEQFDLYGVINNVLNDLLDPRRMQTGTFGGPFNFQPPPIRMFQLHGDLRDYAWGATGLDTIITQLLNQLENTGPPPASEQQIDSLPLVKISQEEFDKNVQCSICMEDFKLDEEAKKLPCKHYFHRPCILEWLKLHGTCPVCRKNLNGEDTSQREYISRPPGGAAAPATAEETESTASSTQSDSQVTSNTQQPSQSINLNPSSNTNNSTNESSSSTIPSNSSQNIPNNSSSSTNQPSNYYDADFD